MGNHDEALLKPIVQEAQPSNRGLTRALVSDQNRDYLINLPRHLSLSFVSNEEPLNLLLVHGSIKSINDYMVVDYPEQEVLSMMQSRQADLLLCGHTHKPFHRIIKDGDRFKHVINIGSVGKPKDGDPRICYAVVEINQSTSSSISEAIDVSFRRVEYDVEKAVIAIQQSEFENNFAEALRVAK